jgi:hypothetical protein
MDRDSAKTVEMPNVMNATDGSLVCTYNYTLTEPVYDNDRGRGRN